MIFGQTNTHRLWHYLLIDTESLRPDTAVFSFGAQLNFNPFRLSGLGVSVRAIFPVRLCAGLAVKLFFPLMLWTFFTGHLQNIVVTLGYFFLLINEDLFFLSLPIK